LVPFPTEEKIFIKAKRFNTLGKTGLLQAPNYHALQQNKNFLNS